MPELEEYDVLIIGGGINGCGTFRDLCLQGLRCLLLEREDFCAGASAASSRLMHGGLKYLETGEFRLVRESLYERNMLLATAGHVVKPLECVVPVRSTFGGIVGSAAKFFGLRAKLNDRGLLVTALGLRLYDIYGRALRAMPRSRMVGRAALRRLMPDLAPSITGAGLYYEGQITHAERLGLELVLDGEAASPQSRALNHAELLTVEGDVVSYQASGHVHRARAKVVVNAGGAWIDKVNAALGIASRLMGGSRGSHLVVDNPRLFAALDGRMVYFGTADGRVNLVYPFGGRVLIGSTDIPQPDPDTAQCDDAEADYMRAAVAEIFPGIPVTKEQVVYRFTGVRPLPRTDGIDIGAVTRDHSIERLTLPGTSVPVLCLIGGKWTTFRGFSEQASDAVMRHLVVARKISTAGLPIGGGRDLPRDDRGRSSLATKLARLGGLTESRALELLDRYGTRALAYSETLAGHGETPLPTVPGYSREEIAHLCRTERVATVEDVVRRRTLIALSGHDTPKARATIAEIMTGTRRSQRVGESA